MDEDSELLQQYTETRSEAAFSTLVQRHLPLVYSAALRETGGDTHQAQDITQTVFTLLARKATKLHQHPALCGWLYTTTHYIAAKSRQTELRRLRREQEAHAMEIHEENPTSTDCWERVKPVIDELMIQLKEADRTAVLLRYFDNRPFREIGAHLGLSENAVRMRLERALNSLRIALARRGITTTAAALGAALSSHAVTAPPAGLTAIVATGASTTAAINGGLTLLWGNEVKMLLKYFCLGLHGWVFCS